MYPSLMGSFSCPALILMIGSSSSEASSSMRSASFRIIHMEYPWILPTPSTLSEPIVTDVPFPTTMVAYQANIECVAEPSPSSFVDGDGGSLCVAGMGSAVFSHARLP